MGHKYIKEDDTFSTSRNGTVPKPTDQEVSDNKVLSAGGSWVEKGGGSGSSSTLDGLDDVDISNISDGQGLFYDSTEQKWKNADPPSGGGDVTDVLQDGESVVDANGVARITTPTVPSNLNDLSDVNASSPSTDDFLGYDSQTNKWVNKPVSSGGGNVDDVQVNGVSVVDENKVAKIKGYKEVTKAQYDALPASKESDGILYCITDDGMVEGNKFAPVIYSIEEQEIGTWIDGKPLYEKTCAFIGLNIRNTEQSLNSGISNVDKMINMTGFYLRTPEDVWEPVPVGHTRMDLFGVSANDFNSSTGNFTLVVGTLNGYFYVKDCYITFRYTKTTDVPGSGKWSSYGVPAHHYSTNEQVIGTWIDGKPLYEKTIWFNNTAINGGSSFAHNINNVDLVVNIQVLLKVGNTSEMIPVNADATMGNGFRATSTTIEIKGSNTWAALPERYWYFTLQYTKTTD